MTTFLKTSQGIFIYVFLFIVIALLLGLALTLQIINKEFSVSRMKSDFISTVSHEFKSPLTSIRQMTEMLNDDRIKSESRKKEYYQVMLEQTERLSHLIENILDFSKIESGNKALHFEKTDLLILIRKVVSIFEKYVSEKGFTITSNLPDSLGEIEVDRDAIQQVLYNLLDNACKYSGESKSIKVSAREAEKSIRISIKDFGIGIKPGERNRIFNRFYRGGGELTRSVKGSGIGLTIVRKLLEAHDGIISVESDPGKGSTFNVDLPKKRYNGKNTDHRR